MSKKKGVEYLKELPAEEANDGVAFIQEAIKSTPKKAMARAYGVCVTTLNKFINGNLNPDTP